MNVDCCHRCGFPLTCSQHGQKESGILRIVCRNHRCLEPPRLMAIALECSPPETKVMLHQSPFTVVGCCASTGEPWEKEGTFENPADAVARARTRAIMSELAWYVVDRNGEDVPGEPIDKDREVVVDNEELDSWPGTTAPVAGESEMVAAQGPFIVAATCARTGKWHHDECEQFSSVADAAEVARANSIMSEFSWYVLDKDREIQLDPDELSDWPGADPNGGEG